MHELALTQQLLSVVLEHATRASAKRVTQVHVVVGALSGVSAECINFHWSVIAADTLAAHALLHFRNVPFQLRCAACAAVFDARREEYDCPKCGGADVRVAHGHECYVEAIDVEEADADPARC